MGAIVIAAALSLADVAGTRRLWRQRRTEFALSIVALLGVALLGVLPGILLAVVLSILNVFRRMWWPHQAELGRVEGIAGLHDTTAYPHAELLPGLVVFRFDAPLIFANSRMFGDAVRAMAEERARPALGPHRRRAHHRRRHHGGRHARGAGRLAQRRGVSLVFAEVKDPVREKIQRYELTRTIDPAHFFPTLDEAVAQYVKETGSTWRAPGAAS